MSLLLSKRRILEKLRDKEYMLPKDELLNILKITYENTIDFLDSLINNNMNGKESRLDIYKTNPLLWEFGHIAFFWEHKTLKLLDIDDKIINKISLPNSSNIYDSFTIDFDDRFNIKLYDALTVLEKYSKTVQYICEYIQNNKLTPITFYLIYLSILHNEMHNESILYTLKLLNKPKPNILNNIIFIRVDIDKWIFLL